MARYDCIAAYIMASGPNGTLYVGVTSDLPMRVYHHRTGAAEGFTKRYKCKLLVWWEQFADMRSAIAREKEIKTWRRIWKIELIETKNHLWRDLYPDLIPGAVIPGGHSPTPESRR
ncbi:MAG TPA: GIY-YIG nuclease family protein, partial [Caulobacterales bacterium]|nr:GIY-YIG nuclease family protein [Caulobacterales bacterium]